MPLLSEFFGIKIYIYWDDHFPPHFHSEYNGIEILVDINSNNVSVSGVDDSCKCMRSGSNCSDYETM